MRISNDEVTRDIQDRWILLLLFLLLFDSCPNTRAEIKDNK
jgi:hypothetical protein